MNFKHISAAAACAAALAAMTTPAAAQLAEGVAAIVNDHVISTFDVRQRGNLLIASSGIQSTPEMQNRARAQALRDLVDEELQMEEAVRYRITIAPSDIDQRIGDIARQNNMDSATFARQLATNGIGIGTLRRQIEADEAWTRLIQGLYGTRLRISEQEIQATQDRIAANASRPQYQISEIFLPADTEQEFNEMEQGAMRLLQEMQRGAPFPLVARQFSRAASAAAGGDIGWIAAPELAPELQPIAERLQAGQVSLPVRTSTGVYIIAMRDRRNGAAAGSTSTVTLRQINAPVARQNALERLQRRIDGCTNLDRDIGGIEGAAIVDLGQTNEGDLSPAIRDRIANVQPGAASPVVASGDQASTIVVCARASGGGGVPTHDEVEQRLREQELSLQAERYLRNMRREATIITRQ